MAYTELQVTTNFSFLRGASHPEEIIQQAAELGFTEIAVSDVNSFAGIVRAHAAAKKLGIRLIPGVQLQIVDSINLLAYPINLDGYASLCELLTIGNLRAEKGECILYNKDVLSLTGNIKLITIPPQHLNELSGETCTFKKKT